MKAKKSLGQNFLIDENIISKIANSILASNNDLIIEIGPGRGALTKKLKEKNSQLICFEVDNDLKLYLNKFENAKVKVIYQDFLTVNFGEILKNYSYQNLFIVGNLPYYITTPILEHIVLERIFPNSITIMVQKEVAERFMAKPKSKEYGYFTLYLQHYFTIDKITDVSRKAFNPIPKVESTVIKLTPRILDNIDEEKYFTFLKKAFFHKRKTLRNNLQNELFAKITGVLKENGYDEFVRAEELSEDIFLKILKVI